MGTANTRALLCSGTYLVLTRLYCGALPVAQINGMIFFRAILWLSFNTCKLSSLPQVVGGHRDIWPTGGLYALLS